MRGKIRSNGALRGGGSDLAQMSLPYCKSERGVIACADNIPFMGSLPDAMFKLIVTSPPYNLGKPYEERSGLDEYLATQERVIEECVRLLHPRGSKGDRGNHAQAPWLRLRNCPGVRRNCASSAQRAGIRDASHSPDGQANL